MGGLLGSKLGVWSLSMFIFPPHGLGMMGRKGLGVAWARGRPREASQKCLCNVSAMRASRLVGGGTAVGAGLAWWAWLYGRHGSMCVKARPFPRVNLGWGEVRVRVWQSQVLAGPVWVVGCPCPLLLRRC